MDLEPDPAYLEPDPVYLAKTIPSTSRDPAIASSQLHWLFNISTQQVLQIRIIRIINFVIV